MDMPPLPLLQESAAIRAFCCESLDDCVEDVSKLCLLCLVARCAYSRRLGGQSKLLARGLWLVMLLLAYPAIDRASDMAGDMTEPAEIVVRQWLRCPVALSSAEASLPRSVREAGINVVGEFVEDGSKLICVASHVYVGALLRTAVVDGPPPEMIPQQLRQLVGLVMAAAAPAAQYRACDEYSDALGDSAELWASRMMLGRE